MNSRTCRSSIKWVQNLFASRIRFCRHLCLSETPITGEGLHRSYPQGLLHIKKTRPKTKRDTVDNTSKESIIFLEVQEFLDQVSYKRGETIMLDTVRNSDPLVGTFLFSKKRPQIELNNLLIEYQTSEGCGLAIVNKSLYLNDSLYHLHNLEQPYLIVKVPNTLVGDKVRVKLLMHHTWYSEAELLQVLNSTSKETTRRDELVVCPNFNVCSGCTLQMINYEGQLEFKQNVIKKAYKFFYPELYFSERASEIFGPVVGSSKQYAYRSKLTPHFTIARETSHKNVDLGFNHLNPTKGVVDISHCSIASAPVNQGLSSYRKTILPGINKSTALLKDSKKRWGETLLLRESLRVNHQDGSTQNVCLTNPKAIATTMISDHLFQYPASEFFQNNNYILPDALEFIKFHINESNMDFKYLIDCYCGSGFLGISLSKEVIQKGGKLLGIEVSKKSILYAKHNAELNGLSTPNSAEFVEGSAEAIFSHDIFMKDDIKGNESVVIIDPSRKGTKEQFIRQLLYFKPKLVIYISCNVFTQARDLSLLRSLQERYNAAYNIKSITGFDFFPQTRHVESIAILELLK